MRFNNYFNQYVNNKFGEVVFLRKNRYDPSKESKDFPCVELESIEPDSCRLLELFKSKSQKSIKTKFFPGDILFGKLRPYLRKFLLPNFEGVCSSEIWAFYSLKILNNYLFYYLQTDNFMDVANTSSGTKMPRAEWNLISNTDIYYPDSYEEMEKISKMFNLLDRQITTQSKIIEVLKSQKKWIYDTVFNKIDSEIVPLGDLCNIKKGEQINGSELNDNNIYPFMNGGTSPSGYFHMFNAHENTISISEGGNSCGYIQFNKNKFWCGGHCYSLINIKEQVNNKYLYHFLKANELNIMRLRVGSGLPNIQKKDLENFNVFIPSLKEQNDIASFLDICDLKINLEELLLIKLKEQKKYLLSNMFI